MRYAVPDRVRRFSSRNNTSAAPTSRPAGFGTVVAALLVSVSANVPLNVVASVGESLPRSASLN